MKVNFSILIFLFSYMTIIGQDHIGNNYVYHSHLQFENNYYQSNLKGIGYLMDDLQTSDTRLYDSLKPQYEQLQKRNRDANAILGVGLGGSAILLTVNTISLISNNDRDSNSIESHVGIMVLTGILSITSAVVYAKKRVKHNDILNFVNNFNQNSEQNIIELSVKPSIGYRENVTGGLSINLTF